MDIRVYALLISCLLIAICDGTRAENITEYINGKLRSTKVKIVKSYLENASDSFLYNVHWKRLSSKEEKFHDHNLPPDMFNKIFVLVQGDEIISMSVKVNSGQSKLYHTIDIYRDSLIHYTRSAKFIKSIVWNNCLYLLICYAENICSVYTSDGDFNLIHRQDVTSEGLPVDANFLIKDSRLFLVIANNLGTDFVASVIYLWTGNDMTPIAEMPMNLVVTVTMFNNNRGAIVIIFGRKEDQQSNISSEVYELFTPDENKPGSIERNQFLLTSKLASLHHYVYYGLDFLLVIDEIKSAHVFWWERKEFLPWDKSNEIYGRDILVKNMHIGYDSFIFVSQKNILSLYKITSGSFNHLHRIEVDNAVKIIDFHVWSEDMDNIFVVSIIEQIDNSYGVESWQLSLNTTTPVEDDDEKKKMNKATENTTVISCLSKLEDRLKERMPIIEKIHDSWKSFRSPDASRYIPSSISQHQHKSAEELMDSIQNLNKKVDDLLTRSRELIQRKDDGTAEGTLVLPSLSIDGDVQFKSLETPSLYTEFINDVKFDDIIPKNSFSNKTQHFPDPLRGQHVTIHHLKVDSLCGISKEHWLLRNDSTRSPLKPINQNINQSLIKIINNTVRIQTDVNFQNIHATTLNSINLRNIIDDLFIIGQRQVINGNLCYRGMLTINNLTLSGHLNGVEINDLMTLKTNQTFAAPIKIDSLNVFHLFVNKLNGVSVEDAARVSQENVIHGKVIVNNLKIKDELLVKNSKDFVNSKRQIHVYDDVEIIGDMKIDRLRVEPQAEIILGHNEKTKGRDVDELFMNSWTKSTDQIISIPIVHFQRGLTIDELNAKYFNGLQEHEYLYTTVENFPEEFKKIHFANLFVKGSIYRGEENNRRLFDVSGNSVIINRRVHIPYLAVQQLYTNRYNGMTIDAVMSDKTKEDKPTPLFFPNDMKFSNLVINERLHVNQLQYETLNNRRMPTNLTNINKKISMNSKNFSSSAFGPLANFNSTLISFLNTSELDITIEGELIIEELTVNGFINDEEVYHYLDRLVKSDIHINNESFIDNITVYHDSSIEFLHDTNFTKFLSSIFSKRKDQEFHSGTKYFNGVTTRNIQAQKINGLTPNQLHYINDSLIFENNVTFTHLSANIQTDNLNGLSIHAKFFDNYLTWLQSATKVNRLKINGSVSWIENTNGSTSPAESLSSFLQHAVTHADDQTITVPAKFNSNNSNVHVVEFISTTPFNPNVADIIEDSAMNIPNSTIRITGKKNFLNSIIVDDLNVDNNIAITHLDSMTIKELNDSLVRKFDNETMIEGDCTLIGKGINISHLVAPNLGPGLPDISALFVISDNATNVLPTNIYIEELIVHDTAIINYFDGISFEKFMRERVSTVGNHVIYSNVQFTEPVQVLGETQLKHRINGVEVKDLVINGTIEKQIIKTGRLVFFEDLVVKGETNVLFINDVDISQAFEGGIINNESAVIESDLIIEKNVKISSQLIVSEFINGFNITEILKDWDTAASRYLNGLDENLTIISGRINESIEIISHYDLPQLFDHLELDENLLFTNIQNTTRIVPAMMDNFTILNVYGIQSGKYCAGLPNDCPCRTQYIVQITGNNSETKRVGNDRWIVYNYREPNGWFEINVKTNTISSSPRCSSPKDQIVAEYTIISLAILDPKEDSFDFDYPIKINGYLKDAKIFVRDDSVYIILAIGYDAFHETYRANSLIYKLDLETYELILKLAISMDAASMAEVFEINDDSYVLIGSSLGNSLLYKLDSTKDEFILIRSFIAIGGTFRHVKSLRYASDHFLFIDDARLNEIHIYYYDRKFDNFYFYQSLYIESSITSIETFYVGESEYKDAFVVATTESGDFLLYEYMIYEKFQLKIKKQMDGLIAAATFYLYNYQYLLLISHDSNTVLRIVKHE